MRTVLVDLFCSLVLGMVLLTSPLLLYCWIRGSYERYVWIISGLPPYDKPGGGTFQVVVYMELFAAGIVLTSIAPILRLRTRNPS